MKCVFFYLGAATMFTALMTPGLMMPVVLVVGGVFAALLDELMERKGL